MLELEAVGESGVGTHEPGSTPDFPLQGLRVEPRWRPLESAHLLPAQAPFIGDGV